MASPPDDDALRDGAYARKQLFGSRLLRWSHGSRFATARALVEPLAGRPLLDYGCGDGTFLARVHDRFPHAVGAEVDPHLVADASARFADRDGLRFVHTGALPEFDDGSFGVAVCMEVLEHCTPDAVETVVATLRRLLARDGTLVVSVPVETGPALLGKQVARAVAARRGIEGYVHRETYAPGELARMVFAGSGTAIARPVYEGAFADGSPNRWHGHKGFNWRALRDRLARDFHVRETTFSPLPPLGGLLNSQAWFLCSPR